MIRSILKFFGFFKPKKPDLNTWIKKLEDFNIRFVDYDEREGYTFIGYEDCVYIYIKFKGKYIECQEKHFVVSKKTMHYAIVDELKVKRKDADDLLQYLKILCL